MCNAPRPNKKAMKIAFKILRIPKDMQQRNEKKVSVKRLNEWFRDSSTAQ
jgi:hypothetical protein